VSNVPAWTTLDLRFGVDMDESSVSWARGIRLNLAILNATDKAPPTVLSTVGAGGFDSGAIDGNNHDPFGRRVSLQLSKAF
jgi:outer membrane receptor protein involved in Fe transport